MKNNIIKIFCFAAIIFVFLLVAPDPNSHEAIRPSTKSYIFRAMVVASVYGMSEILKYKYLDRNASLALGCLTGILFAILVLIQRFS
jgi:hypothetical protein